MCEERCHSRSPMAFIFLMLLVSVVGFMTIKTADLTFTEHSLESHSEAVSSIEKCFDGGGDISPTFKMSNGRWGQYCKDGSRNNYWRILDCKNGDVVVVTQFKQALRKLANYITNHQMTVEEVRC